MSLLVYECQRADHGHEIRQFGAAAQSLYDYFEGRDELALFIGNVNIGEANLDGLIVKRDAIIIVEFKDYEGSLMARQNGQWTCDGKEIKGGAGGKSVFDQLRKNQRILRKVIGENNYFTQVQRSDIKGLVVLTKLIEFNSDFDRTNKAWIYATDVEGFGSIMHDITSADFRDIKTGTTQEVIIEDEDIFSFLRKFKIEENALVTDFSDTGSMPSDLYNASHPHNGKRYSLRTLYEQSIAENERLKEQLESEKSLRGQEALEHSLKLEAKDNEILKKEVELQQIRNEKLEAEKKALEFQNKANDSARSSSSHNNPMPETISGTVTTEDNNISRSENPEYTSIPAPVLTDEPTPAAPKAKKRRFGNVTERVLKQFHVEGDCIDKPQLDLIDRTLDQSMIISGCAGSGKSIIALYKAQKIMEEGGDVIMIAYTVSLSQYMKQDSAYRTLGKRFFYYQEWINMGRPSADYVIVDEIQDFTASEIDEFTNATRKSFFFFGDTAQSIYRSIKPTMTLKALSEKVKIKISTLHNNYRLPKGVAKIAQNCVGVDVEEYTDSVYQSKETAIPHIVSLADDDKHLETILDVIKKNKLKDVGILVPNNDQVLSLKAELESRHVPFEYKYTKEEKAHSNLVFPSDKPKIMTYHSAKGLQFETVFLPYYQGASSEDDRKSLYVAMTRTYRFLYIFYSGNSLPSPHIPNILYDSNL